MRKKVLLTAMRLDVGTRTLLKDLATEFDVSMAQVMRRSVRLMKAMNDIRKQDGEILLYRGDKIERLILLLA